jgi:multidrug resistance efflux pump
MAKGRYNIKGTKDFLVATVVCVFLCLWAVRDAWLPTDKILKKHPQSFTVTAPLSGRIKSVAVKADAVVGGEMVLVELDDSSCVVAVRLATQACEAAKGGPESVLEEKFELLKQAKADLSSCAVRNTDFILDTSHGEEPLKGRVLEVFAKRATYIEAGDPLLTVRPRDTFYAFNKTLSVVSFIGALVFLYFHRIASR